MSYKQFYANNDKAIKKIRSAATDYNVGVIEADSAMIRVMGALADLDKRTIEIVKEVQGVEQKAF